MSSVHLSDPTPWHQLLQNRINELYLKTSAGYWLLISRLHDLEWGNQFQPIFQAKDRKHCNEGFPVEETGVMLKQHQRGDHSLHDALSGLIFPSSSRTRKPASQLYTLLTTKVTSISLGCISFRWSMQGHNQQQLSAAVDTEGIFLRVTTFIACLIWRLHKHNLIFMFATTFCNSSKAEQWPCEPSRRSNSGRGTTLCTGNYWVNRSIKSF